MNEEKKALPTRPHLSLEIHKKPFEVCMYLHLLIKSENENALSLIIRTGVSPDFSN